MTETETKTRAPRASGPRTFKPKPTPRERVLSESLARSIKKHTGRDVSPETVRAVRWTFSRWDQDPETKQLREDMDGQLKLAKLQERREKALALLAETETELKDLQDEVPDLSGSDDDSDDEDDGFSGDDDGDEDLDDSDPFDESNSKVSSEF